MKSSFLENLCHSSANNYTFWGHNEHGHCYELLTFVVTAHTIFGLVSSAFISRIGPTSSPNLKSSIALGARISISLLVVVLFALTIALNLESYVHELDSDVAPIDFLGDGIVVIAWVAHVGYLITLRKASPSLVRGHTLIIISWLSTCLSCSVGFLTIFRQLWVRDPNLSPYEKWSCIVWVCLQGLYVLTLLPSVRQVKIYFEPRRRNLYPSINADQQGDTEPLLSGRPVVRYAPSSYGDSEDLGVAIKGAGILSRLTLWWTHALMKKGARGGLSTANDVFQLPRTLQTTYIEHYFKDFYSSEVKVGDAGPGGCDYNNEPPTSAGEFEASASHVRRSKGRRERTSNHLTLLRGLIRAFGVRYSILGVVKFVIDVLAFAGPLLLNQLVKFIERSGDDSLRDSEEGFLYAFGLFASTLVSAFLGIHFNYQINNVMLQIRAAVVLTIYHKAQAVTSASLSTFSTGEIVNFMSVDSERIVNFCNSFHSLWSLPLQIGVALFLLHQQLGLAFLTGLGFALLLIPINKWLTVKIQGYSTDMMDHKDGRVKVMNEVLHGIRVIKYYAWERHFADRVEDLRDRELRSLQGIKYLDAMCVYFWATTPVLISILTFTTYAAFHMGDLTAAKVFTSVALFNMLIGPLNAFPWVINGVVESWVSIKRVQSFMELKELDWTKYYSPQTSNNAPSPETSISIQEGYFHWEKHLTEEGEEGSAEGNDPPETRQRDDGWNGTLWLENINLHIFKGQLVGVIGPVGSGKSSLLAAITAEMTKETGHVCVSGLTSGFGLVNQEAWIQHATVKENIIFGNIFNFRVYNNVVKACALEEDFKALPAGDDTEVGENGVTLSGGQKARVALARAVYQDKDIYLLDDPLSAVDAHVGAQIFNECIMGLLKNKTRILCTHHTKYLQEADVIVVMQGGQVKEFGPPGMILSKSEILDDLEYKEEVVDQAESGDSAAPTDSVSSVKRTKDRLVLDEEKETGTVKVHVYKAYWQAVGNTLAILVLTSLFLMQASRNISDWWLSYWVVEANVSSYDHKPYTHYGAFSAVDPNNLRFYLGVYGGLAAANSLFTLVRAFSFAKGGLRAAGVIHKKILTKILKAPVKFFEETPVGRILNRFSSDIYTIDEGLPFILNIFLAQLYGTVGSLVITCVGLPWFMLFLIPIMIYYYTIQRYYRITSRELKRIYSITMSPIYAHFSESLAGLTTIRALRATRRFKDENKSRLETNQRARFSSYAVTAWLSFRLQMLGVAVVTLVAFIAVLQHHFSRVSPGLVGLVLAYSLSITNLLINMVKSFTETEKNMISMERAQQYIDGVPAEKDQSTMHAPSEWPSQGHIHFDSVSLSYRAHLPNALEGVSFIVEPGEKIGIVGRTGAGKSSLFLALFRMVQIQHGAVVIDGIDVAQLPLEELRSRIAVIPQDPFLFNAPVRENLDPRGVHGDDALWIALDKCHLRGAVQRLGGLGAEVGEHGRKFSVGQRQLLCLARAILTAARILCIDEATASVDMDTDRLLQQTIREEFADKTVLTIAHRTKTILDSDKVLVMNNGKVVEFSPPTTLLQDRSSYFSRLVNAS